MTVNQEYLDFLNLEVRDYSKERELVDDIAGSIDDFLDFLRLPKSKHHQTEKILVDSPTLRRDKKKPRVDILVTHNDDEITFIEAKVPKYPHELIQGVSQLLYYREFTKNLFPSRPNLVLAANMWDQTLFSMIESNKLDVIYAKVSRERYFSGNLREFERS